MIKKFNLVGYHVTRRKNIPNILKEGLTPKVPEDYGENGDLKGVYLFKTIDDATTALYQWFGERLVDWEEENGEEYGEVLLEVNLSGLQQDLIDSVEYEWTCITTISPDRILSIKDI